jgi:hypothetical protein
MPPGKGQSGHRAQVPFSGLIILRAYARRFGETREGKIAALGFYRICGLASSPGGDGGPQKKGVKAARFARPRTPPHVGVKSSSRNLALDARRPVSARSTQGSGALNLARYSSEEMKALTISAAVKERMKDEGGRMK